MIHHQPIINLSILLIITGIATIMSDLLHHIEDFATVSIRGYTPSPPHSPTHPLNTIHFECPTVSISSLR